MAQNTLEIVAKVKADVSEAQKQFQQLFAQFQNFKLDKNATADITKSFSDLNKAFEKLQIAGENAAGGKATVEQLKNIGRASQDVDKAIANLNRSLNKVGDKNFVIDMDTPEFVKARQDIEGLSQVLSNKYTRAVEQAKEAQATLANSGYTKTISGYADLVNALGAQDLEKAQENFKKLQNNIDIASNSIAGSIKNLQQKIADAVSGKEAQKTSLEGFRDKIKQELDGVKADLDSFSSSSASQAKKNDIFSSLIGKIGDNKNLKLFKTQLEEVKATLTNFTPKDSEKLKEQLAAVWNTYQNTARPENISAQAWSGFGRAFQTRMGENGAFQGLINSGTIAQQKVDELKAKLSTFGQEAANLGIENPFNKLIEGLTAGNLDISKFDEQITKKIQKINADITKAQTEGSNVQNIEKLTKQAEALKAFKAAIDEAFGSSVQSQIQGTNEKLGEATNRLSQEQQAQIQAAAAYYRDFANAMGEAGQRAGSLTGGLYDATDAIVRQKEELGQVISRFAQFGTMAGIIRTFTKVVRSAFQSVKELDEAMNNIAVVTDYTTKDLWNQIDAYTAMAQATGSTIKGSYEVAQLYYQQGLTDAEVMAAANETLKMARISNIDYAAATDYATAAVKGFGLAYQDLAHINDVYSNLAAKTAADTEEISIAMSKVASIAHSTGMELETTAAFLTQIIATTREAPETAGTALKTVIARFAEVKKLISQGEVTGTDEEGTEIDINNIETALKTAGVALRDTTGQMRDLDDVFIELASRWDSLDTMQQRYIATQAAGSRQQSRFLAMMNDYEGLQETLGYAMDSEGASQEQFNKTLDSLQSKLNNLSNAWTEFTTGVLNQDVIKFGIDALTKILNLINDITGSLGPAGNTISKTLLLFGALRYGTGGAGSILNALGITNNLPTIKDQWKTGALGNIISTLKGTTGAVKGLNTAMAGANKTAIGFWKSLAVGGKAAIVIAALALIAAAIYGIAKVIKTTKEQAQEFQDTLQDLKDINNEITDTKKSLSDLYSYKEGVRDEQGNTVNGMSDFKTLLAGVDKYGQNVGLTSEQYSRYLEISNAIVALNPDIAEGYNSNAAAVANQKEALDKLIESQKESIRLNAIRIAVDANDTFYEDAAAQNNLYYQERDELQKSRYTFENQTLAMFNPQGTNRNREYESLLGDSRRVAGKKFELFRKLSGAGDYSTTIEELTNEQWKFEKAIRESGASIEDQGTALWVLQTITNKCKTVTEDYGRQIELIEDDMEKQQNEMKDLWISMLPGVDGYLNLTDAQQKFIESSIKNMEITSMSGTALTNYEMQVQQQAADYVSLLQSSARLAVEGYNDKTFTFANIFSALDISKIQEMGYNQGLSYIKAFYDAIIAYGNNNSDKQEVILSALGLAGTMDWNSFVQMGTEDFANSLYGEDYFDVEQYKLLGSKIASQAPNIVAELSDGFKIDFSQVEKATAEDLAVLLQNLSPEMTQYLLDNQDALTMFIGRWLMGEIELADGDFEEDVKNIKEQLEASKVNRRKVLAETMNTDYDIDKDKASSSIDYYQRSYSQNMGEEVSDPWAANIATNAIIVSDGLNKIADSYETWTSMLANADASKMTQEQVDTYTEMQNTLRDMFHLPDDWTLPLEDMGEILELLPKLAKGDEQAFKRLGKIIGSDFEKQIKDATQGINVWKAGMKDLDGDSFTDVIDETIESFGKLSNVMEEGIIYQVGEMNEKLDGLSFNPDTMINNFQAMLNEGIMSYSELQSYAAANGLVIHYEMDDNGDMVMEPQTHNGDLTVGPIPITDDLTGTSYTLQGSGPITETIYVPKIAGVSKGNTGNSAPKKSGGGGGGGGKAPTKPKQDPFYNYIKTADDYKKRLESLQDVQELLTKPIDIFNNTKAQEDYYKTLLGSNQSYLNHVNSELERLQKDAQSKYSKYIEVSIDGSLRLTEEYWASTGDITEELDEWIDAYDDVLGRQKDLTDEINDYKKELKELWEGWRDSFIDLTNDIADVFQELDEKQLEDRQEFYEKLEEQDQRYLESVRNNIEEERKARERANNFEDLQKKQNRLALLQRDSSGRYANDIAELQEEINSDQQDLADQNVDNILDTLEKQMDKDAERHQDILDAMQKQIDSNIENRIYIERAEQTIAQGEQAILDAIHMGEDWRNASNAEREKMDEEQATNIAGSKSYLEKLNEGITSSSEYISKMVTDALTKQTESLVWTIGDIPQNDEAHVAHAMETTLPSILEQFFARTNTAQDMADDNKVSGARYATGGLVDYTGPAWVDGTPGKPEAFLNANQTAMIASFTANLAKMISGKFPSSNVEAGSNCEINIDIGSIGADYDIDQAINKVKQEIVNSAQFRNVTLLNRRR